MAPTATSISSSISSLSLKKQKTNREEASPTPEPDFVEDSNVLSALSKGTQRLFGTNNSSNDKRLAESLNEDYQFYKLAEGDGGAPNEIANLNNKSNKRYSENFSFQQSRLDFKSNF